MRAFHPFALVAILLSASVPLFAGGTEYTYRTVASGMSIPWELAWGPDGSLWATERQGVVSRIDPETGERRVVLDHAWATGGYGEGGMLGMCFHPDFQDSPYVYLAVNYATDWKPSHRTLERWTYSAPLSALINRVELLRFSPTAFGHQGGRLAFGMDKKLYLTLGENYDTPWEAQNDSSFLGKVIRVNTDGTIPDDNPIPGNPMWTKGHRNPQGILVFDDGRILTAEHGNVIEDEINLLQKGGNYGWPAVEGPCDEPDELAFCDSAEAIAPFFSSGTRTTWAFSDIEYYNSDRFPKLKNSILLATLRHSSIYVLHLNEDRTRVDTVSRLMPYAVGRIRDIAISPDGRIFVSTSNYTDPNANSPFPIEGDNHIYELMPLQEGTSGLLVGPADTVRVTSYEKEHLFFTVNVTNIGDAPTTITDIERVIKEGPIDDAHWDQPFVIMPGMTYPIIIQYYPWERGENIGHVRLISDNSNNVDIYIKGTCLVTGSHKLTLRPVASDLRIPWEIQWGPDSTLWTTERAGIVSRIDPESGQKSVILDHRSVVLERGEGGLLGLALHPQFPDSPYVYLAMNHGSGNTPEYRTVERWRYQAEEDALVSGTEIFRITPSAIGHQGCRLQFGPDGMLYVTSGENWGDGWIAQDTTSPLGKVLRLRPDGSIPDDNPIPGNPMWTLGHRNPQGLVILPDGTIFTSEHGNIIEDEVNKLVKGANYGWPGVEGPCDDEFEQDFCDSVNPVPPFYSSGTEDTDAYSDLDFYDHERYPVFRNSLLMATLKRSTLFQLHLNAEQTAVDSVTRWFPYGVGRIRDIEISPDGRVFICTSNRDPNAKAPFPIAGDDRIYEIVPVEPGGYAELQGPDTVWAETFEDETVYFSANVTNVGTAPTLITDIERVITAGPLDHAHWRKPFVIMPGMTYPVELRYFPWESGDHVGQVRLKSDNSNDLDIHLVGKALPTSVLEGTWSNQIAVHPQPFSTTVRISVPETIGSGTARILDLDGREVWTSAVEGTETLFWNGEDSRGRQVAAGTYVLVISDGTSVLRSLIRRSQP